MCLSWMCAVSLQVCRVIQNAPGNCFHKRRKLRADAPRILFSRNHVGGLPKLWFYIISNHLFTLFIKLTPIHRLSSKRILSRQKQTAAFVAVIFHKTLVQMACQSGSRQREKRRNSYRNWTGHRTLSLRADFFPLFDLAFSLELYYFYIRSLRHAAPLYAGIYSR